MKQYLRLRSSLERLPERFAAKDGEVEDGANEVAADEDWI